jgi:dihydrofolate synthase/folylpolyglutamate synthase
VRYSEAIGYLYGLSPRGVKVGLERMERALAQRGHPERRFRSIVVAGTNGKGSVSAMIASVLQQAGFKVGLYTSPHMHRLVERFRVNGRPLAERELAQRVGELVPWLERAGTPPLTFFEICTLLAFEAFRDHKVDFAVLEVGLGGRLDATNVVTPEVSVITRIALDHADRLGATLAAIAREKAGIARARVPLVTAASEPSALRVIRARARRVGAPLQVIGRDFAVRAAQQRADAYDVRIGGRELLGLRVPLRGSYQADNLGCAVAALGCLQEAGVSIREQALRSGLRRVRWPGRLELIAGAPSVLLDAAHNPDACLALAEHLRGLRATYRRTVLLFGVLADKEHAEMLRILLPQVDAHLFATPPTPRALPARALASEWGGQAYDAPVRALARARRLAGRRGLVVAAGSIFLMAEVRARLLGLRSDPPIAM